MKIPTTILVLSLTCLPTLNSIIRAEPQEAMPEQSSNLKTPEAILHAYERGLSEQSWDVVKDFIHEDGVFIFTESTFRGKEEIRDAFEKTFDLIKEEKYWLTNLSWVAKTDDMVSCEYIFHWEGIIHGTVSSGGGRGSSVLIKTGNGWKIVLEHLGPPSKQ